MPRRSKATLRELRTVEATLAHHADREKAFSAFRSHVELAMQNGPDALRPHLTQALYELDTSLRVALRHHELRLQELQTITKFPDEDPS